MEKHRNELYRYVLRVAWDPGKADDIFSAGILSAYENLSKFTPGTNFRAWMYRIVTNKCYVANRETSRAFRSLDEMGPDIAGVAQDADYRDALEEPEHFIEQCGEEVKSAFDKLSQAERSCLMLRAVEQFSYKEIADTLDMPVGTVMTHLSRGRAKMRTDLLDYGKREGLISGTSRGAKAAEEKV